MAGSQSVNKLKGLLNGKIIRLKNSKYRHRTGHVVVNYGNSRVPTWLNGNVSILNHPNQVRVASNKLTTLQELKEHTVPTVPFTTDKNIARQWLEDGSKVFIRHELTGHSGEGIEVLQQTVSSSTPEVDTYYPSIVEELNQIFDEFYNTTEDEREKFIIQELQRTLDDNEVSEDIDTPELPDAPLYTKGVSNNGEYRVHVFDGEVILYQKKSRRVNEDGSVMTPDGQESDVRNLSSNWVYRTGHLNRLERVELLAVNTISSLGLDFGSVDIIKDENGDVFVLEVNTASGLGNTETQEAYRRAFNGEPVQILDDTLHN